MSCLPDLKAFPVNEYQEHLTSRGLLPGRVGLLKGIEMHFEAFRRAGIVDADGLKKALSAPQGLARFLKQIPVPEPYLVLLKREVGSLLPKPLPIKDLIGLDGSTCKALADAGIRTAKDLFEAYLSEGLGPLPKQAAEDLFDQCGLVRISGMGSLAAKMFMAAGYGSCKAVADADDMLERISAANADHAFYKGNLGSKDMQFCIYSVKFLVERT